MRVTALIQVLIAEVKSSRPFSIQLEANKIRIFLPIYIWGAEKIYSCWRKLVTQQSMTFVLVLIRGMNNFEVLLTVCLDILLTLISFWFRVSIAYVVSVWDSFVYDLRHLLEFQYLQIISLSAFKLVLWRDCILKLIWNWRVIN